MVHLQREFIVSRSPRDLGVAVRYRSRVGKVATQPHEVRRPGRNLL